MIDLNSKIEGASSGGEDFSPIPNNTYHVIVEKVSDWKSEVVDINVNQRDEHNKIVKDGDGKNIKVSLKSQTLYKANVTFTVTAGDFKGRKVFLNLSTHPDIIFRTQNLLWAVGKASIQLGDLQRAIVGLPLDITVEIKKRPSKVVDKTSGATTYVDKDFNDVTAFAKPSLIPNEELDV